MAVTKSLENLSLGGVAAVYPQALTCGEKQKHFSCSIFFPVREAKMPKKYRIPQKGEVSTYQGPGMKIRSDSFCPFCCHVLCASSVTQGKGIDT